MNATDEGRGSRPPSTPPSPTSGRVDVLVNTAGILRFAAMEDLPLSDWNEVINVNLTGYFITSQRFWSRDDQGRPGRLVHISTVASHSPRRSRACTAPPRLVST